MNQKKRRFLVFLLLCVATVSVSAQSTIPADANEWFAVVDVVTLGDTDPYQVVFFEVPDTITSDIYFAIESPGLTGPYPDDLLATVSPDEETTFTLIGGAGAISDPESRYYDYASGSPFAGNVLDTQVYLAEAGWHYFNAVSPSQGEKIGNKYYFKVVAQLNPLVAGAKNGFRLSVDYLNSGTPSGIAGVDAFAYAWTIAPYGPARSEVWNFYPFVPSGDDGEFIIFSNWDADLTDAPDMTGSATSPSVAVTPVTISDQAVLPNIANTGAAIGGGDTGTTWDLSYDEGAVINYNNVMVLWNWNSLVDVSDETTVPDPTTTEVYRTYAAPYTPAAADRISLSVADGTALSNGTDTETVTLQVVDASGNPVPYQIEVYVQVSGAAQINATSDPTPSVGLPAGDVVLTTDASGIVTFDVVNAATQNVTISLETDGPGGGSALDDNLPETTANDSGAINFVLDLDPTVSSAGNTTVVEGASPVLPDVRVVDLDGGSIVAGSDVRIVLPAALTLAGVTFDAAAVETVAIDDVNAGAITGTAVLAVTYEAGDTVAVVDITGDFGPDDRLTIGNLTLTTPADSDSVGNLGLSFDGDTTADVNDDKIITILDSAVTAVWEGDTDQFWNTDANWSTGLAPGVAGKGTAGQNAVILDVAGFDPTVNIALNLYNLSVVSNVTVDLQNFDLAVTNTFSNDGVIALDGTQTLTLTPDGDSGEFAYDGGTGGTISLATYYDLRVNSPGQTFTLGGVTNVANTVYLDAGVLATGGNGLTVGADLDGAAAGAGTLTATGADTITVAGDFTPDTLVPVTSSVVLSGSGNRAMSGVTFASLQINDAAESDTTTPSAGITVNTAFTVTAGTWDGGAFTHSMGGNWDTSNANATFTASTSTISFTGTNPTIALEGNETFANLTLADGASITGALTVGTASDLDGTITGDGSAHDYGNVTLSGATTITTANGNITLGTVNGASTLSANAGTGSLTLGGAIGGTTPVGSLTLQTTTGAIALPATTLAAAANLNVTAGGAITDTGAISVPGTTTLTAPGSPITLDTAGNDFSTLILTDGGTDATNVTIVDTNAIVLGGPSATSGTFALTAGGNVTNSGALDFVGQTTITAPASNVTLTNAGNDFGTIVLTDGGTDAVNVSINDTNAVDIGASAVSGTFDLTAGGNVTDSGQLQFAGAVTIDATGSTITLNDDAADTDTYGSFDLTATTITIDENAATDIAAVTATTATFASTGAITDSGALSVSGTATFTAPGNPVTLDVAGNDFGTIILTDGGTDATNAIIVDTNGIDIGASAVSGTFDLTAGGNVTDSGQLQFTGAVTIDAGANTITLNDDAGDTDTYGSLDLTATTITIDENAATDIAATTATTATFASTGAITDSGALAVTGTATFTAPGSPITLDTGTNNFGTIVITDGGTDATNVVVVDANGIALGGPSATSGTFALTAGGNVTNSGALDFAGQTTITAPASNVTLTNAGNDFGTIVLTDGGTDAVNVSITDSNAIDIGASAVSGTFDLTAGGNVTDSGQLQFAGAVTIDATGSTITLNDDAADTDTYGSFDLTATTITIDENAATDIAAVTATTATFASTGAITDSGALSVSGTATFTAPGNPVTLDVAGNDFGTIILTDGGTDATNAIIVDTNGIDIGASAVSGTFDLTAGGNVTDSGQLQFTGAVTIDAGANTITLNDDAGDTDTYGSLDLTATTITIDENAATDVAATTATTATFASTGAITDSGALAVTGTATFTAPGSPITLDTGTNNFGTIVITDGGTDATNVVLVDADTVIVGGPSAMSGTLGLTTGGNITQSGALSVTGNAVFTATAGDDIILGNTGNFFGGSVTFNPASLANVSVYNSNTALFTLGAQIVTGTLTVQTEGPIAQSGALVGTTLVVKTFDNAGSAINLGTSTNNFATVSLEVRDALDSAYANGLITFVDADGFDFGSDNTGTSNGLLLTPGGALGDVGGVTISTVGNLDISSAGNTVTLDNAGHTLGNIVMTAASATVAESAAMQLGAVSLTGAGSFTAVGGDITDVATVQIGTTAGTATFRADGQAITLDDAANDFDTLIIPDVATDATNVTVVDVDDIILGGPTATSGTFSLTAGGAVTDSGQLAFGGTTTITAAGSPVTLDTATNDFATVVLTDGGTDATNVTLVDTNGIDLGASATSGTFTLTAGGNVTDSGQLVFPGTVTIDATGASITLDDDAADNDAFGSLDLTATTITIDENAATDIAAVTATTAAFASTGAITDSGTLAVTGTATFTAPGSPITLDTGANDFGTVVITDGGTDATNVLIVDVDGVALGGPSATSGTFTLTAGGDVTNSGALAITGLTTITAAGSDVTLNNAGNDFSTIVLTDGGTDAVNATIVDTNAIVLGASATSGTFSLTAGGNVTDSGQLTFAGATTIDATGFTITLDDDAADTDTYGSLDLTATTITIDENAATDIAAAAATTATFISTGAITDSGALAITGTATFTAPGNPVTLDTAGNDFGTIVLTDGGSDATNVTVVDTNGIDIGASAVSGTFDLTAGGNVTDSGQLTFPGAVTIAAAGSNITLNDDAGDTDTYGGLTLTGADITVDENAAMELTAVAGTGNAAFSADGAITQTGIVDIDGTASFDASTGGGNPITLTNAANDFTGAVALVNAGANNVAITDVNAILLGTSSIGTGTLDVTAVGISQSGATTITQAGAGDVTLQGGNGNIDLTNANVLLGLIDSTTLLAFTTQITSDALRLRTITSGGAFTGTGTTVIELHDQVGNGTAGGVDLNGSVELHANATIDATAADGTVTVNGSVDDDGSNRTLTIDTGDGQVVFDGSIGAVAPPVSLSLTASSYEFRGQDTGVDDIITQNGIVFADSPAPGEPSIFLTFDSVGAVEETGDPTVVWPFDVYVDLNGGTLLVHDDMTFSRRLVLYGGLFDANGLVDTPRYFTVTDDLVILGGTESFDDQDWTGADTRFQYPEFATLLSDPGTGNYNAQFPGTSLNGVTFDVGGDFYVNGASMVGTAQWNLVLPDASGAVPVYNAATPTDPISWGSPYAVAFNMTVDFVDTTSAGIASVAAASDSGGPPPFNNQVVDGTNNDISTPADGVVWDFDAPEIENAWTLYDDYVSLDFDSQMWNRGSEIATAIGLNQLSFDGGTQPAVSVSIDTDGTDDRALPFVAGTTVGAGDLGDEDTGTPSLLIRSPVTWATDADGTSGGHPASTDEAGNTSGVVPDITMPKGLFFEAVSRNLIIDYGPNVGTTYTGTEDRARPAIVRVVAGRHDHVEGTASLALYQDFDGHNYFEIRFSEEVDIPTAVVGGDVRAEETFVGRGGRVHEPGNLGTVSVEGYFTYPGDMTGGSTDTEPATSQLYRTPELGFWGEFGGTDNHFLTIVVKGTRVSNEWVGYIEDATDPSNASVAPPGEIITVVPNPAITDLSIAANVLLDDSLERATVRIEPASGVGGGEFASAYDWDVDPPDIAQFSPGGIPTAFREVVAVEDGSGTLTQFIDHLDINFLGDPSTAQTGWDSSGDQPNTDSDRGVRHYSVTNAIAEGALLLGFEDRTGTALNPTPEATVLSSVQNYFFDTVNLPPTPATIYTDFDGPYVRITLDDSDPDVQYQLQASLWLGYQPSLATTGATGIITDHAGNLLTRFTDYTSIERQPPEFATSLVRAGSNRVYLRFTEPVKANDLGIFGLADPALNLNNVLLVTLEDGTTDSFIDIDSATLITPSDLDPDAGVDFYLELSRDVTAEEAVRLRIRPLDAGDIRDLFLTPILAGEINRLSDVLMDVVIPTAAWNAIQDATSFGEEFNGLIASTEFDGSGVLLDRETTIQLSVPDVANQSLPLALYYDVKPDEQYITDRLGEEIWLPIEIPFSDDPDDDDDELTPANPDARRLLPVSSSGATTEFTIPATDPEIRGGALVELIPEIDGIPAARYTDANDPTSILPWSFTYQTFVEQLSGVTILNNVIYPENNEQTLLRLNIERAGLFTVNVFSLDGQLVKTLLRGRQAIGEQLIPWDGTNTSGQIVASGLYFIRVVGPGVDEIRKVLIAK